MQVKFKKLHKDAVTPTRGTDYSAGYDLTAISAEEQNGLLVVHTGLAFEIPVGYVGLLFSRSSIANKDLILSNCVGVIDSDYRGEVMAKFRTMPAAHRIPEYYEKGHACMQLIIMPYPAVTFEEASELSDTKRGTGGYGSTGE